MTAMRFVNHASFAITHDDVTLLADPWFFGSAFNDGWDLLVDTPGELQNFDGVTHIWFSHEHPDHFSVPTLRAVPEERRRNITILFQKTRDKRVVRFCERLGFTVVELDGGRPFDLAAGFSISVWKWGLGDSFCRIDAGGIRLLNLNDCVVSTARQATAIARAVGPVDVLLSQFSYANWCGNEADVTRRRREAAEKLMRLRHQIEAIRPHVTVPFASFAYFSHDENFYLNDCVNTPAAVRDALGRRCHGSQIHFMSPGEAVDLHDFVAHRERYDDRASVDLYAAAYARIAPVRHSQPVTAQHLQTLAEAFGKRVQAPLGPVPRWLERIGYVRPLIFRLPDLNGATVRLSYARGLEVGDFAPADCRISSGTLAFLLKNDFGYDAVEVSGQFRTLGPGAEKAMSRFFSFSSFINNGFLNPLTIGVFLMQRLCRSRAPRLYVRMS